MRISDWSSDVCSSDLGAAIRGAIGHVVADHVAGLGRVGDGVALALGAVHHLAADVLAVDAVADIAAGHGAGRGRDLLAAAAADLVADQATDDRTGHGAADVAVALGQALLDRKSTRLNSSH